jgi:RNA polymerase sigma-70 factor, ECF subfamily
VETPNPCRNRDCANFYIQTSKTDVESAQFGSAYLARYPQLSSVDLVRACAGSKDEDAWAEFIRRFQVVIAAAALRTARRWCDPSRALLDDLVQDTYLKLCEENSRLLRSFQPRQEDSIYGFLKVVAANVVHDHFKAALAVKRGAGQSEAVAEPVQNEVPAPRHPFDLVSHRLQLEQIDKALRQVTAGKDQERKCTIFWFRHRQGMTASEIASIPEMGLTTEGVESMLLRLAAMIRDYFRNSNPHREVKVLKRKNRSSKRTGA